MQTALKHWRPALIIYTFQFFLALTLGAQAYHVLEASIGNSLELNKLMNGYNHTVFSDFLNEHGASITPLLGQLRWILLFYVLSSAFLNAGLLYGLYKKDASWTSFWKGGAAYFWPFLRINLFFWLCTIVLAAVLFIPFANNWTDLVVVFPSEKYVVWLLYVLIAIFLIKLTAWYVWSLFAKIHIMQHPELPNGFGIRHLKAMYRPFWKKYRVSMSILLLFCAVLAFVSGIYWFAETRWGMTTPALIVVFFLLQQALVFFRIFWKISLYDRIRALVD